MDITLFASANFFGAILIAVVLFWGIGNGLSALFGKSWLVVISTIAILLVILFGYFQLENCNRGREWEYYTQEREREKQEEERKIAEQKAQEKKEEDRRLEVAEEIDNEIIRFARKNSATTISMIEKLKDSIVKFDNNAENTRKRLETLEDENWQGNEHYQKWISQKEKAEKLLLSLIKNLEEIWCEEPFCSAEELNSEFDKLESKFSPKVLNIERNL